VKYVRAIPQLLMLAAHHGNVVGRGERHFVPPNNV